jgi:hypothetical protein
MVSSLIPGGDDGLADVAPHQVQVHEHLGDHRDRRDGHGRGHEQREDQPVRRVGQQEVREVLSQDEPARERDQDPPPDTPMAVRA